MNFGNFFFQLVISTALILIGLKIYINGKYSRSSLYFLLISISSALWTICNYFANEYTLYVILVNNLTFLFGLGAVLFLVLFSLNFPNESNKRYLEVLLFIPALIFEFLLLFTDKVVKKVIPVSIGTDIVRGEFFYSYLGIISVYAALFVIILIIKIISSLKAEKEKIKWFLIAVSVTLVLAIFLNLIAPTLLNLSFLSDFGPFSVLLILISVSYTIQKFDLYDGRVIATELAVYVLWFILAVNIGYSEGLEKIILSIFIFLLSIIVGRILVKSVIHEIQQRKQIQKLADELKHANERLKDLDKLKDDFISMAAHELNTPLAAISGYLSMILEEHIGGEVTPKIKQYLERMFSSSKRLALMVHDMLNVSRIESGRIHLIYTDTPIENVIEQAIGEIMSKAKERKQALTFTKPKSKMPKTWFDVTRITEVLINLLGNAIKYTDPGGKIDVGVKNDKENITVWIKDNGRGIPENKKDVIFEKFSQVDILDDQDKGTGLGMYISKKFIELQKGKIWFESAGEGKGSTFYFSLPIIEKKPFDPHEGEGEVLR